MHKSVTSAELAEMAKKGTVKLDPTEQNIARFGELIDKLNQLLEQKAADTQADLARSQVQLEILATLQKTMSKRTQGVTKSQQIDLSPLTQIIAELQESRMVAWEFDIQRNGPGEHSPMAKVIATPIQPTKH